MSRFNRCPHTDQFRHIAGIFYYLKIYPNKSIKVCSNYLDIDKLGTEKRIKKGEWNQDYRVIEEIDDKYSEPSGTTVESTIFVDSN